MYDKAHTCTRNQKWTQGTKRQLFSLIKIVQMLFVGDIKGLKVTDIRFAFTIIMDKLTKAFKEEVLWWCMLFASDMTLIDKIREANIKLGHMEEHKRVQNPQIN